MKKYKSLYERVEVQDIYKLADYLESKIDIESYKKQVLEHDRGVSFTHKYNKDFDFSIDSFVSNELVIILKFKISIVIKSTPLANPRLNYQDTSAVRVLHKKIKLEKDIQSLKQGEQEIDKFLKKLDVLGVSY